MPDILPTEPTLSTIEPTPGTTTPAAPSEELYDVVVSGKPFKVPKSELISGYQRQRDYTNKTMELAEQRRAWDAERAEHNKQLEQLREWISKPENVYAYYQHLLSQSPQPQQTPGQPVTADQLAAIQRQMTEQLEQRLAKERQELTVESQAARFKSEIDAIVKGHLQAAPELARIGGIEDLIIKDVRDGRPSSMEEAKQLIKQAVDSRATAIRALIAERTAKPISGTEPPGGARVPTQLGPMPKLGSPELKQLAIEDLKAALAQG